MKKNTDYAEMLTVGIDEDYAVEVDALIKETDEVVKKFGFKDREDFGRWAQSGIPDIRFHFDDNPDLEAMPTAIITDGDDGLAKLAPPEGTVSTPDGYSIRLWHCQWIDLRADLLDRYKEKLEIWDVEEDSLYAAGF